MKVVIHVEQIIPRIPVYHVGVGYRWGPLQMRYDYQPEKGWGLPVIGPRREIVLGKSKKKYF